MVDADSDSDFDDPPKRDPEVTLEMASLLAIFFGLVVLCGAFFGFGYSVGKRFVPPASASAAHPPRPARASDNAIPSDQPTQSVAPATKPSADGQELRPPDHQSSSAESSLAPAGRGPSSVTSVDSAVTVPVARPGAPQPPVRKAIDAGVLGETAAPARPIERSPSNSAFPDYMVQIAAISRPADGDALIAALRKRGYNVSAYTEPQDKLLHVQIGPFTTRADANAMRQKLLADGYNAIIK